MSPVQVLLSDWGNSLNSCAVELSNTHSSGTEHFTVGVGTNNLLPVSKVIFVQS
jgi:hypothetical protein